MVLLIHKLAVELASCDEMTPLQSLKSSQTWLITETGQQRFVNQCLRGTLVMLALHLIRQDPDQMHELHCRNAYANPDRANIKAQEKRRKLAEENASQQTSSAAEHEIKESEPVAAETKHGIP